jgi:integrase
MGIKIKKSHGKWYVSRDAAEAVRRQLEARLALGNLGFLQQQTNQIPTFLTYSERWLKEYAEIQCKPSTVAAYRQILTLRLLPRFGPRPLDQITRDQVKQFIANLASGKLSRNTLRNTLCTIRVILNQAIEDGLIDKNPAARLGRFTRSEKPEFQATALTRDECNKFLEAAQTICPEYYVLFLTALRAGLRRGELVALQWSDIQFGASEEDSNRFILVQHNYVNRQFTTPKSKECRRVDLSRQVRRELLGSAIKGS